MVSGRRTGRAPQWLLGLDETSPVKASHPSSTFGIGSRNNTLCSLAGGMRRKGAEPYQIDSALQAFNQTLTDPLSTEEVRSIAHGMSRYDAAPTMQFTDRALADKFAQKAKGELAYAPQLGWLSYSDGCWREDVKGLHAQEAAKRFVAQIESDAEREAAGRDKEEAKAIVGHAKRCQSAGTIRNIEKLAMSNGNVLRKLSDFDTNPNILNVKNGVVDLRDGSLVTHNPALLLSKQANVIYDPDARCPRFDAFLDEVLGPPKGAFLLRALGYSLLDTGKEQKAFILCGSGRNGKTTLTNVFRKIFDGYATTMDPCSLLRKQQAGIPNDIARLKGVRTIFTSELPQAAVLDAALLKRLVGNERVTARFLHQEFFEFEPRGVIFLASNHVPIFDGSDFAMARRMCLIQFDHCIPLDCVDPHLETTLLEERSES